MNRIDSYEDLAEQIVNWIKDYYWDNDLNALRLKSEDRYYYEEYENGLVRIQELAQAKVMVFPNPTSTFISFEVESNVADFDVRIYSSFGRLLLAQKGNNGANIDIRNLPAGQYFYILEGKDFGATGVFVTE